MKRHHNNSFSKRFFLITGLFVIAATAIAIYLLSSSITQTTKQFSYERAQRSFHNKYDLLHQEFSRLLEQRKDVEEVLKISSSQTLTENLALLSSIQLSHAVVLRNQFQVGNGPIYVYDAQGRRLQKSSDSESWNKDQEEFSIREKEGRLIWRHYFKIEENNNTVVRYSYDIDLEKLHDYFSLIDSNASNYAIVFDQDGTCIFHPDVEKIGKNVFDFAEILPTDTLQNRRGEYREAIVSSEYLQVEVLRFIKPMNLKGLHWQVGIHFPKMIADEKVGQVRRQVTALYLITTFILGFIFYLFNRTIRREYVEKEALVTEKNQLLLENERVHKENALIQLQQLKEQIDPHFLFNSLNSLYMLIDIDSPKAKKFTINLSKIYRYLIDPPTKNIVELADELGFIEKYMFLQRTRFQQELQFSISIEEEQALIKNVPYLSLQICIENAIKHNLATVESPLKIEVLIREKSVIIRNNLQKKKEAVKSSHFGLRYLQSIYDFYSEKNFKTFEESGKFICVLPLID